MADPTACAPYLWVFTSLLVLRVAGQVVVALRAPHWLPPMERWQSGLVPYWFLLATQCVVVWLMVSISTDFSRGEGYWLAPASWIAPAAYYWSYLYAGAMIARYAIRMRRYPDQRWFGGTIPIIFHTIVAAFQWTFGWCLLSS
jgi:hypothetical protein